MKRIRKSFIASMCLVTVFVLWTVVISFVDVRAIGPQGSSVGFAGINGFVHNLTGVHFSLYNITDWLGLVPIFVCMGFGILGFVQWIKRKSICKVDYDILILLFESVVINYRPVLINGYLEASYPSSTTMLMAFITFMVIGRLVSGVHWFTDIVGGALLSSGLVMLYYSVCRK